MVGRAGSQVDWRSKTSSTQTLVLEVSFDVVGLISCWIGKLKGDSDDTR